MRARVAPIAACFLMLSYAMSQVPARGGVLNRKRDPRNQFEEVQDANIFDHINRIKRNLADVLSGGYSANTNTGCDSDSWQCGDRKCIPMTDYCDGIVNCIDGTDEAACNSTTRLSFVLHSNNTVPVTTVNLSTDRPPGYVRSETGNTTAIPSNDESNIPSVSTSNSIQPSRSTTPSRNAATGSVLLDLKIYPQNQEVKYGDDVVFQCRDEGPQRARVTWRMIGSPIKVGSSHVRGRLEMYSVTQEDSGTYICEAEDFIGFPGSQVRVTLQVNGSTPTTFRPAFVMCRPNEATCANGQCIPKAGVCDGRIDCSDKSDEDNCHQGSLCEPNQFQCKNGKCVLKTWLCDSENDCSDGSDEENCGTREEGKCAPVEFTCAFKNQCISKSFHCDGQSDCIDGSDEIGCLSVKIISGPEPSKVRLDPNDTLILRSEAVGVPAPVISWRLNMGHVPAKCSTTNVNGVGILTCPNIQPEDSGAYSSEATNSRGTIFAPMDAIVIVGNAT